MTDPIQSVGIREFRSNLHKYTTQSKQPIAITSNGIRIGFYIPTRPAADKEDFASLRHAAMQMNKMLQDMGVTEEEIVAEFDETRKQNRNYPKP